MEYSSQDDAASTVLKPRNKQFMRVIYALFTVLLIFSGVFLVNVEQPKNVQIESDSLRKNTKELSLREEVTDPELSTEAKEKFQINKEVFKKTFNPTPEVFPSTFNPTPTGRNQVATTLSRTFNPTPELFPATFNPTPKVFPTTFNPTPAERNPSSTRRTKNEKSDKSDSNEKRTDLNTRTFNPTPELFPATFNPTPELFPATFNPTPSYDFTLNPTPDNRNQLNVKLLIE